MRIDLKQLSVRPVTASEEPRYRELMQQHHYLGDLAKIGHTLWHIATYKEVWIALLTFSASALKCAARDRWIGWDFRHQYGRYSGPLIQDINLNPAINSISQPVSIVIRVAQANQILLQI